MLWEKIAILHGQYLDTYYQGLSGSLEEDEEKIRKELETMGAYSVLADIEEQLNRFEEKEVS